MDVFEEIFAANRRYADSFPHSGLPTQPSRRLAVLCCMDSRIDLFAVLGLGNGEVHMVRNAGGVVTDDAVRSLSLSHWALGTESILVIQHTRCGLEHLDEAALRERIRAASGRDPGPFGHFDDVAASVREGVARLRLDPVFRDVAVRGAVYDVDTGHLNEV